jgi:hypothetical protein
MNKRRGGVKRRPLCLNKGSDKRCPYKHPDMPFSDNSKSHQRYIISRQDLLYLHQLYFWCWFLRHGCKIFVSRAATIVEKVLFRY